MIAASALILVAIPLVIHAYEYPGTFMGFSAWTDQSDYVQAARAWSVLNLSPALHHYPPLYPLLGAFFVRLTPWQPFLVPDAVCWAACLPLFVWIGRRLAPSWPALVPAGCFLLATLAGRRLLELWVIPWTTTGAAPCQFGALLLAMRFRELPSGRRAFPLGLVLGLLAGIRPSDAVVLSAACLPSTAFALASRERGPRAWLGPGLASLLGLVAGVLPAVAAHVAVFGLSAGDYLSGASANGVEWRLLPMRWVMLVLDARPLLPQGLGMTEVFPWILPGFAGLCLALLPRSGHRASAALAGGTVALHWALYLSYRDLQPSGLWRFNNVHYFKWTFPFLALWAMQLAAALVSARTRWRAAGALAMAATLFVWRPMLTSGVPVRAEQKGHTVVLPSSLSPLDTALRLPLSGSWQALYFGFFGLHAGGQTFLNTRDFKVAPVTGGVLIFPLRPLPAGPATLDLPWDVNLAAGSSATMFRQAIVPGIPCGLVWWRTACQDAP